MTSADVQCIGSFKQVHIMPSPVAFLGVHTDAMLLPECLHCCAKHNVSSMKHKHLESKAQYTPEQIMLSLWAALKGAVRFADQLHIHCI